MLSFSPKILQLKEFSMCLIGTHQGFVVLHLPPCIPTTGWSNRDAEQTGSLSSFPAPNVTGRDCCAERNSYTFSASHGLATTPAQSVPSCYCPQAPSVVQTQDRAFPKVFTVRRSKDRPSPCTEPSGALLLGERCWSPLLPRTSQLSPQAGERFRDGWDSTPWPQNHYRRCLEKSGQIKSKRGVRFLPCCFPIS